MEGEEWFWARFSFLTIVVVTGIDRSLSHLMTVVKDQLNLSCTKIGLWWRSILTHASINGWRSSSAYRNTKCKKSSSSGTHTRNSFSSFPRFLIFSAQNYFLQSIVCWRNTLLWASHFFCLRNIRVFFLTAVQKRTKKSKKMTRCSWWRTRFCSLRDAFQGNTSDVDVTRCFSPKDASRMTCSMVYSMVWRTTEVQ